MNKKIGFVGCGNMGSAMVGGILNSGLVECENIIVSCKRESSIKNLEEKFNIKATLNNIEVCKNSEIIFLAVKPFSVSVSFSSLIFCTSLLKDLNYSRE